MAEFVRNGGFENPGSGATPDEWTLTTGAVYRTSDPGNAHAGSAWILTTALDGTGPPFNNPPQEPSTRQSYTGFPTVQDVLITFWINPAAMGTTHTIELLFNGVEVRFWSRGELSIGGGWQQLSHTFLYQGSTSPIVLLRVSTQLVGMESSTIGFDDVSVQTVGDVAITQTIKDALVADLQDITTGNGFATTIAEVGREPKRYDDADKPGAYIISGTYVEDPEEAGTITGKATQSYIVQLLIESATPNADMDDFFDDVRNACERSTSNLIGVSGVHKVDVTDADPQLVDAEISQNLYLKEVTVAVEYSYTRGAA